MAAEFVPFLVSVSADSTVSIPGQPSPGRSPFTPLPKKPSPTALSGTPADSAAYPAPTVTLKRDGDRVTQIQIRCACGQLIELDCTY
jgi:hypothetical protein